MPITPVRCKYTGVIDSYALISNENRFISAVADVFILASINSFTVLVSVSACETLT